MFTTTTRPRYDDSTNSGPSRTSIFHSTGTSSAMRTTPLRPCTCSLPPGSRNPPGGGVAVMNGDSVGSARGEGDADGCGDGSVAPSADAAPGTAAAHAAAPVTNDTRLIRER